MTKTRSATLGQFLLDRFDEEAEIAEAVPFWTPSGNVGHPTWALIDRVADPARVLAQVAANRDIVREHQGIGGICSTCRGSDPERGERWPCRTLRLMAFPYLDHPDMREEWRP